MGGDPQYMWGQARSGQPAGRIFQFPPKCGNWLNRGCRGCQEACGFNLRWVINSKVDFWKNWFLTQIRTTLCRLPGRGLFFSEITRHWNFGMCSGEDMWIYWSRSRILMNIGPTLSYNPFWLQKSSDVLHQMHPRLENTVNYCSEFRGNRL